MRIDQKLLSGTGRVALVLGLLGLAGCATTGETGPVTVASKAPTGEKNGEVVPDVSAEDLVFVGADGGVITWSDLVDRAKLADVIVLGEQHDDPLAHRFQAALVAAVAEAGPVAVCMEMFERDEQPFIDAYLADAIGQKTLVEVTDSKDWGAKGKWDEFYQPIVDAAKAAASPVVGANAPRHFTRLARAEDFAGLAQFEKDFPVDFVVPTPISQEAYAARFMDTMKEHSAGAEGMPAMTDEKLESFFRAQQVWDATMAASVLEAYRAHGKAMLMVGQFHTDFDGGLLLRMKAAEGDLDYFTVSVAKAEAKTLREEDQGRADVVVYRP